jgi:SAM-dependent methyltransferase
MAMEKRAYQQYLQETEGWLQKGRRFLLAQFVERAFGEPSSQSLRILEIGAGCGKSAEFLADYGEFQVVEVEQSAINMLRNESRISKLYDQYIPFELNERFDLVVAMDVIEHIEDDQAAFDWIYEILNPGGVLFISVPAYQWMFSNHDVALSHMRRYSLKQIHSLNGAGMEPLMATYFNFLLFPLALLSRVIGGIIHKKNKIEKQSSRLPGSIDRLFYKILQMEARLTTAGIPLPWGLSAVVAYKK